MSIINEEDLLSMWEEYNDEADPEDVCDFNTWVSRNQDVQFDEYTDVYYIDTRDT